MHGSVRIAAITLGFLAGCAREDRTPAAPADPVIVLGEAGQRLDRFLAAHSDSGFNGSVLWAQDGRILLHKSYGWSDSSHTRPVTNDTAFWIASNSKQFAASAVLALEEAGTLSTADSIGRFFENLPADKRGITLHQLLTHSAGLVQRYAADGITDRDEAVRALLDTALVYPPGTGFGYSNDAYNLIAAVVEVASGRPYESFVLERILRPAGLTHTGFWGPRENPEVAAIYGANVAVSTSLRPNWGFRGATGMHSTSGDFYRWHRALQEHRVLSAASVARLQGEHVARGETQVGYGWFTSRTAKGARAVWTRGYEGFGHGAYLATYPESGTVIVILTNSGEQDGRPVSHRLAKALEDLVFEDGGPGATRSTP